MAGRRIEEALVVGNTKCVLRMWEWVEKMENKVLRLVEYRRERRKVGWVFFGFTALSGVPV